jgi:MFS family permease
MTQTASQRFQIRSIFASYWVAGVYWGAFVATLPAFERVSGLSTGSFGWLLTLSTIGGLISMQLIGRVLHRVQAVAIPLSLLAFAVGMVIMGMATGPVSLGAALLVAGAASGTLDISLNMRVARIEGDFDVRLFNRVHALFPFSMLVNSLIAGFLRDAGVSPAVIFSGAAVLLIVMSGVEWMAGQHQRHGVIKDRPRGRIGLRGVLITLGALAAVGGVLEIGASTWSAIFVEGNLGGTPAMAGIAAAAMTLGLTTGRLIAHRLEHRMRDMVIIRIAAAMSIPAFVVLSMADQTWIAMVGLFVAGIGVGPIEPAVYRSVARRFPEADRGRALALVTGLAYAGFLTSPPLLGAVIDGFGWPAMWLTLCAFAVLAAVISTRVPPSRPEAAPAPQG